jgi:5-methyltetrahydrofolate--homocysteine methyltransferase
MKQTWSNLKDAIVTANNSEINKLLSGLRHDVTFNEIYDHAIHPALDNLCDSIKLKKGAVPDLLMGLKEVRHITDARSDKPQGKSKKILVGVVEGDIHDMGKNVIRDVCLGYGYDVTDLGKDVSVETFVHEAKDQKADIVCLSTMMSTTIEAMKDTIDQLKAHCPYIRIVVGGAFMNRTMAESMEADGYAEDASMVRKEIERILM